jgi:hypothetical protein
VLACSISLCFLVASRPRAFPACTPPIADREIRSQGSQLHSNHEAAIFFQPMQICLRASARVEEPAAFQTTVESFLYLCSYKLLPYRRLSPLSARYLPPSTSCYHQPSNMAIGHKVFETLVILRTYECHGSDRWLQMPHLE